jgi:serine protease
MLLGALDTALKTATGKAAHPALAVGRCARARREGVVQRRGWSGIPRARRALPSFRAVLLAALLAPIPPPLLAQSDPATADAGAARVIVKFKADSSLASARALSPAAAMAARAADLGARLGLPMRAGATISDLAQVVFASGVTSAELAQLLAQQNGVEYAVPDERRQIVAAPNDPLYAAGVPGNGPEVGQWYLRAPSGDVRSSLDIEAAWAVTTGSPGIVVAVVDTGVRYEHPDLLSVAVEGRLLPGYDMTSDPARANDGDREQVWMLVAHPGVDDGDDDARAAVRERGGTFFHCTTSPANSSWHGTQISGLIAALTNDGIGMAGVAPGVGVLPVRVLGKCGGYDSDIIAGMLWATGLPVPGVPANPYPARVINLSLGGDGACSAAYQDVVDQTAAGTVIVAAVGNSSGHAVAAPANCRGVIAVSGLRHVGTKVGFASLGPEATIGAPGGNCVNTAANSPCLYPILTTSDSGTTVPVSSIYTDSFNTSLGTSFSTPLVAGVAALVLSVQPAMTPQQVGQLLQGTARPFPPLGSISSSSTAPQCTAPQYNLLGRPIDQLECYCTTTTCGAGMLDAGAALLAAESAALGSVSSPAQRTRRGPG